MNLLCRKHRDKIKRLFWEGDGFLLLYKEIRGQWFRVQKRWREAETVSSTVPLSYGRIVHSTAQTLKEMSGYRVIWIVFCRNVEFLRCVLRLLFVVFLRYIRYLYCVRRFNQHETYHVYSLKYPRCSARIYRVTAGTCRQQNNGPGETLWFAWISLFDTVYSWKWFYQK